MSREMALILLGLWVVIVPNLGIPSAWRTVLLVLSGAAIAVLGFLMRGNIVSLGVKKTEHHPFAESMGRASDMRPEAGESVAPTNEYQ